jgi:hypothetical protein
VSGGATIENTSTNTITITITPYSVSVHYSQEARLEFKTANNLAPSVSYHSSFVERQLVSYLPCLTVNDTIDRGKLDEPSQKPLLPVEDLIMPAPALQKSSATTEDIQLFDVQVNTREIACMASQLLVCSAAQHRNSTHCCSSVIQLRSPHNTTSWPSVGASILNFQYR